MKLFRKETTETQGKPASGLSTPPVDTDEEIPKSIYPFPISTKQGMVYALPFLAGIAFLLFSVLWLAISAAFRKNIGGNAWLSFICICLLIAGLLLLLAGIIGIRKYMRFFRYLEKIGSRTSAPLSDLILSGDSSGKKAAADIRWFLRNGYFPEGHLDDDAQRVYLTDAAFEDARK